MPWDRKGAFQRLLLVGLALLMAPTASAFLPTYIQPSMGWQQDAGDHTIQLECPPADASVVFSANADTVVERSGCPFRVIDGADLLGSPSLAVDPINPNRIAFFSLHGCATDQGAHPWSRTASGCTGSSPQTHTTFTSMDEGRTWTDWPHGNSGFGEGHDGTIDREGRLYMAHLFSHRIGSSTAGEPVFDYFINVYKPQDWDPINYYSKEIPNREPGNKIEAVSMSLVTPWTRAENLEQYNETQNQTTPPPSTDDDIGNRTVPVEQEDTSNDLVVVTWHERAYDFETTSTGKSSWIGAAWTDTSSRNQWELLDTDQLIGPCRHASNSESWNGRVYVACAVDAGYTGRRGANIGDVDIWAIDLSVPGGEKQFVAQARGIRDGALTMDMNDEGMMALASLKPVGDAPHSGINVDIGFSWYGRHWGNVANGAMLHQNWGGEFVDARITAMELLDGDRPTLFMSYMERLAGPAGTDPQSVDPDQPLSTSQAIEYRKSISAWEPCGDALMALSDLNVGVVRNPFEDGVVNGFTGAFYDFQDGLVATLDPFGRPTVYFAFGDHGVVQYGTIRAEAAQDPCIIPPAPILFPPPAVAPVALTTANTVGAGMVAAVAGPAGAMFGYLLIAKRRAALAAVTKSK